MALLYPQRAVVNVAGDGDFLMTGQALSTAVAHGARKLVCIVVDNASCGTIRMHQEREFPGRTAGAGSDLFNPDFATLARAHGWQAERVDSTAEFGPAFVRVLAVATPTLPHLRLPAEVITSYTTLTAIRAAALKASTP